MERTTTLANRLAEAILFDWDKEEVIKLAKEVAVACKENIDFTSLVKRMREAQKDHHIADMKLRYHQSQDREIPDEVWNSFACTMNWMVNCEDKVDEYLKKMEI